MEQQVIPRKLRKLNRCSFEENAICNNSAVPLKKWKTRTRLLSSAIPDTVPSTRLVAIVSPIQSIPVGDNVASVTNHKTVLQSISGQPLSKSCKPSQVICHSSQKRQPSLAAGPRASSFLSRTPLYSRDEISANSNQSSLSPSNTLSALNQKSILCHASPALNPPPQTSKAKCIVLKRNCTPVTSNIHMQFSSLKTSTPKPALIKHRQQRLNETSRKLGVNHLNKKNAKPHLDQSKVSSVSDHKRKTIRIGTSPILSALERKRKQQQKLKIYRKEKNSKCHVGSNDQKLTGVSEGSKIPTVTKSQEPMVEDLFKMSREGSTILNRKLDNISINTGSLTSFANCREIDDLLNSQAYLFVLDTNVLMHKQKFINILKDTPLGGCGPPYLYTPWIVLNELNGLKSENSKNKKEAHQAIKYLHSMFTSKHPRFLGQRNKMSAEQIKAYGDTNDDKLISSCKAWAEKIPKDKLALLSNDSALCIKVLMCDINAYTTDNLFLHIKPDVDILPEKMCPKILPDNGDSMMITNLTKSATENSEINSIVCKAKTIFKNIMGVFLNESMKHAFGDMKKTFLTPPPITILDILGYYEKYWVSVFAPMFNKGVKKSFDTLKMLFNPERGLFLDVDDAFAMLIAIENICKAIALEKPSINRQIGNISQLTDACKALSKSGDDMPMDGKKKSKITLFVFNHLWSLMDYFCGMIMDFAGLPHDFEYDKPAEMPPLSEFQRVLTNFYPALRKIKLAISKVVDIVTSTEQADEAYKCLYDSLVQFVPSLQIKAPPAPTEEFTLDCLKHFMLDPEYREKIKIGHEQLKKYEKKLSSVIHLPIWEI